jgi:GntR family transcriptional regulator, transcriptional repressor for pyruvate dehydrogenase complex
MLHVEADHAMVWEAREALEVHAARLSATRRTRDDLSSMHNSLAAMAHAIESSGDGADADASLHRAIVGAAHNPLLEQLFTSMADAVDRTSAASLSIPGRPPESLRAQRAIVEAISDGDPDRSASEMTSHLRGCARSVIHPV